MFSDLKILQLAGSAARHAAERQSVIAENVANANTPGYKARDVESFQDAFERNRFATDNGTAPTDFQTREIAAKGATSPNGNTVSLEDQVWRSADAARSHDIAITIYSKAISLLRASIGGRQ